ncbi:glycosyltransferase family 1 protein [Flavobacterium sp. 120]|uniref:glycosyltransferase family 4 protein n=1 Tax=Flavobacterium sp. 120 TaxID=2135626 RepID=UPI000EAB53F2|nr:glycosyltransferase family 1 protein [Flavobacterium sp. 120]RKS13308.1 glycosyltransferase involved in cell wall biosynthesis [Flavobacterium sp. 120]
MNKLKVMYFQRKPKPGFNFSLEFIFDDIRKRLNNSIDADIRISSYGNNGIFTKIANIFEAAFRQSKYINHITGETHFLNLLMNKKRVVLTILDCGPMFRKKGLAKEFVRYLYLVLPIKKAAVVITISETVKKEILSYTNCLEQNIIVIPVAVSEQYKSYPKKFNAEKPIVLQIGTGPNKNVIRLIEALKDINCHLVIVGKLNDAISEAIKHNNIEYSNYVGLSDDELLMQYKLCDIVSFISTFEGFGMPIVEANCIERVVITSNTSSMPEVASDAACLVDPFDIKSIKNGFLKVIQDEAFRDLLINNGKNNRNRFNAEKIAQSYLDIYKLIQ